jgi:CRISPR/Cas system-associated endoribonuclease Cas2
MKFILEYTEHRKLKIDFDKLFIELTLTEDQRKNYGQRVREILHNIYPNNYIYDINEDGNRLKKLKKLPFEKDEKYNYSIFNWIAGNTTVTNFIIKKYNIKKFEDLIKIVEVKANQLFIKGGECFNEILRILRISSRKGRVNESKAIYHINYHLDKAGFSKTANKTKDEQKDTLDGIDIEFIINDINYTCQAKPLLDYTEKDGFYEITSTGFLEIYNTDFMCFAPKNGHCLLFLNKEPILENNKFYFKKEYFVNFNNLNTQLNKL